MGALLRRITLSENFRQVKKHKWLLVMLLPGLILLIIFKYIPIYGVVIAFEKYRAIDGIWGSQWVWFDNFKRMFVGGSDFWIAFKNTVEISLLKLALSFPAAIVLAILLNEVRHLKFKKFVQTVSYLPHFLSWVIVAGMVASLLSPSYGAVNYIIKLFGGDPIYFMTNSFWFRVVVVATEIWKTAGWSSIVYLAAITSIDPQLYEAAKIDGAGRIKQAIHITVPCLTSVIVIMLILSVGKIMNAGFDQILNMYNIAVYDVADILDTYVYRLGISKMDYSFATAVGLFKNVIGVALVLATNKISQRFGEAGLW